MIFRKAWQMTAREPNWAHRLSEQIQFYWPVRSHPVRANFPATAAGGVAGTEVTSLQSCAHLPSGPLWGGVCRPLMEEGSLGASGTPSPVF